MGDGLISAFANELEAIRYPQLLEKEVVLVLMLVLVRVAEVVGGW